MLSPLLLIAGAWFVSDAREAERAHDDAMALWNSKEPTAYSFEYGYCSGMCMSCRARVTVENGKVTDTAAVDPAPCSISGLPDAPTIEEVFALEESGRSDGMTDSFEIVYDPTWGFPASVSIRCPEGTGDCGTGFGVSDFRVEP